MKYTFIVCVYNGSSYIDSCLLSLINQTYKNFEIIIIDDGSTDCSLEKLSLWKKKYPQVIQLFPRKNNGLSVSRNFGVKKATGDYFLFVDIDDTLELDTLETVEKYQDQDLDLLKINYSSVYEDGRKVAIVSSYAPTIINGEEAFKYLVETKMVFEMAQLYIYHRKYWIDNKFEFTKGRYHEDFGLIPDVILHSNRIKLLNNNLYNYLQTQNSITRNSNYEKIVKRANDILEYAIEGKKRMQDNLDFTINTRKLYNSFVANAVLNQLKSLQGDDHTKYVKEIETHNFVDDLLQNTWKQKLKKIYFKLILR